jgi:hypothetical protein
VGLYEPITERFGFVESCEDATMDELVFSHEPHLVWVQDLLGVEIDMGCDGRHLYKTDRFVSRKLNSPNE